MRLLHDDSAPSPPEGLRPDALEVARLRARVLAGKYHVDGAEVAEELLLDHLLIGLVLEEERRAEAVVCLRLARRALPDPG